MQDPQANVARVVIPRERIAARVAELAKEISGHLDGRPVTLAALMTGSVIFVADLIRHLPVMMKIRLVGMSSYPGTATQSEGVEVLGKMPEDLSGQTVLIVDDILDTGRTLGKAAELVRSAGADTVLTCVLLSKNTTRRAADGLAKADYVGFHIADEFVVGYGLDHGDYYRNLPDIAVLKETPASYDAL